MTGDRAGLGAQTFLLPQPKPQAAAPAQQPFNDGVQALEGLQYVKGQTADYYKKVADLKSFMQSVQQNLGVDVRVPDLSRPESVKLNQIYRDAIADIQAHGNALKTGLQTQNLYTQMNQQYAPGIDPTAQPAGQLVQGQDVYSRQAEAPVMEVNNKLQMPSYTEKEHKDKLAARQELINHYDNLIKKYPERKAYYEYQKSAIITPTEGDYRPSNASSYDRKQGALDNAMEVAFRKAVNFTEGVSPEWKVSTRPVEGSPGRFYRQNTEYAGLKYGDYQSPIKAAYMHPDDGTSFFLLQDGTQVPFTKEDIVPLLQGMADTNPRFGFTGAQIYDYAQRNGLFTGTGAVDRSRYIDSPENQQKQIERMQKEETEIATVQSAITDWIKKETKGKDWHWYKPNDRVTIPIKFGGAPEIKLIAEGNNTFNIENFEEVFKSAYTKDGKVDPAVKADLKTYFQSEQPIETILQKLLPMIPKAQYAAVLKALGIDKDKLPITTGTNSAPTKQEDVNPFLQ